MVGNFKGRISLKKDEQQLAFLNHRVILHASVS
jgi:hypothetical protein